MREPEHEMQVTGEGAPRSRLRTLAPLVVCAAAIGLSCWGNCPPVTTAPVTTDTVTIRLRPSYVLTRFGGTQALPVILSENPTIRVRLLADTLTFSAADSTAASGTYTETLVLGITGSSGPESLSRTVSPSRSWTRSGSNLSLSAFAGGGATAPASASLFNYLGPPAVLSQMNVFTTDGRSFAFEAR